MENRLVEDNLRLVHFVVRKFGDLPKETYEDYFQEGCVYLTLAAERFDVSKGFAFSTFAAMVLDVIEESVMMILMALKLVEVLEIRCPN